MKTWTAFGRLLRQIWPNRPAGKEPAGAGTIDPELLKLEPYHRSLSAEDIAGNRHREAIGGRWEEIGQLQFNFLLKQGLKRPDRLLDIGCGSLRAGLHFIRYLDAGNYCGIDCNASILEGGGRLELIRAGLEHKQPRLLVDGDFAFEKFGTTFRYALAQSVFTHIPINAIQRCLVQVAKVLEPGGRLLASYFDTPDRHGLEGVSRPTNITSYRDRNPYHQHFSLFEYLITDLPLRLEQLGDWGHPRGVRMLAFIRL